MADDEKQSLAFLRLAIPFDTTRPDDSALLAALGELPNGMKAAVVRYMLLGAFQSIEAQGIDAIIADALREQKARGRSRGRPTVHRPPTTGVKKFDSALLHAPAPAVAAPKIEIAISTPKAHVQEPQKEIRQVEAPSETTTVKQGSGQHSLQDFASLIS